MSCCCIPLQLALMLVLTFAPCTGGVFLPPTGANTPLAHVVVSTCSNLHWWCYNIDKIDISGNQNGGALGYCFRALKIIFVAFRRLSCEQTLIMSMC